MSTIATALGQITSEDAEREASERKARDETAAQYVELLQADKPDAGALRACMRELGLTADDVSQDHETVAKARRAQQVFDGGLAIQEQRAALTKRAKELRKAAPKMPPGPPSAVLIAPRESDAARAIRLEAERLDGLMRRAIQASGALVAMARARPLLFTDDSPPRLKGQAGKARPKRKHRAS